MTIRPVHIDGAITLEEYRALDLTRPLTDPPIGANPARRANDAAASAAFDEGDRPAVTSRRRPVGPRGYLTPNGDLAYTDQNGARGVQKARRAAQTAGGHIDHPRNGDDAA